jgi:hypothetical protein
MPTSLYTENSEKWKSLASIDYLTQFVKAWIPFNAWYRSYYPDLDSDRKAINEIKATQNKFRDKLISLLTNEGNDGVSFKSRTAELHLALEEKHIYITKKIASLSLKLLLNRIKKYKIILLEIIVLIKL